MRQEGRHFVVCSLVHFQSLVLSSRTRTRTSAANGQQNGHSTALEAPGGHTVSCDAAASYAVASYVAEAALVRTRVSLQLQSGFESLLQLTAAVGVLHRGCSFTP